MFISNHVHCQEFTLDSYTDSINQYSVLRLERELLSLKLGTMISSSGNNLERLENYNKKIIIASKKMISLDKENGEIYFNIGHAYYSLSKYAQAIPEFTEGLKFPDGKLQNLEFRGKSKLELKDSRGAKSDFENAISESEEPSAELYFNKGFCNMLLDDFGLAMTDFSKAIHLESENGKYYFYRGAINLQIGKINDGCMDLSNAGNYGYGQAYELINEHCNQ